jgi:hypothetical protein
MKGFKWSSLKSKRLKDTRGVSFEEIVTAKIVDFKDNPHRQNQQMLLFEYRNYIWLVPCVETETCLFLKTLYPSRKYTKLYKKEESNEKNQVD